MKQEIKDYECPYCHNHFLMKRGGFSNHLRWCKENPKYNENLNKEKQRLQLKHQKYLENKEKNKKEYKFNCKECGKEYSLILNENNYNKGNYSKYCCRSCANTRHYSNEIKEKISEGLKNSVVRQQYLEKIHNQKIINDNKRKKNIYNKCKRYYCGSKELDEKNPDISCRQSPKYFNKLIPFGLDITKLYTEDFIQEHTKVKQLLYKEYVENCLSPKDIYNKYNCKEYFNNSETLLHLFKGWEFPIRSWSKAVQNAWLTGNLKQGCIYVQYKSGWHTTWNGKEVFFRSSFELDYAKELDEKQIDYEVEFSHIKYWDSQKQEYRCAIPDFYIPKDNMIVEIKSLYTLDKQNMIDKKKAYLNLGYKFKLICDHNELEI